jgi:DNA polymerase III delta subunit
MNFNQWKAHAAKGSVSKVTYCCGDQTALVELVVEDIRTLLNVPTTDYIELDADNIIWELASQYPLDVNANRLVVVRHADKLDNWQPLSDWMSLSRSNPNNYLLFVSSNSDAPVIYDKGKKVSYLDHIELIRTKGKFIKCSQPNDEDLVSWAKSYGLTEATATYLVERASGDTARMYEVLKKIHIWNGSPNNKVIDVLCDEQALDSFADYLILRDKKNAYLALSTMSEEEKAKTINRLDSRLDLLMEIGKHVRKRMYAGDIAATTGIKIFLVKRFMPLVKEYDDRKIKYCRQILAMTDGAIRDGAKVGVWESLVTLW